jgi:hypothetical protein
VKLAIVGSGLLAESSTVTRLIDKSLAEFEPEVVLLYPGHDRFNTLVRARAALQSLAVREMQPPRAFWVGKVLQSVRKRLHRGVYARTLAREADLVLGFKAEGRAGVAFSQLLDEASEGIVVTIRQSDEILDKQRVHRRLLTNKS